eukprot:8376481-Pyramimonas_sp.AAC.1
MHSHPRRHHDRPGRLLAGQAGSQVSDTAGGAAAGHGHDQAAPGSGDRREGHPCEVEVGSTARPQLP